MIEHATPASPNLLGGVADVLPTDSAPTATDRVAPPILDLHRVGWALLCSGCALAAWGLAYALIRVAL
ncbi:hypothetical protein TSH58p_01965 (plasmid) [Azospirillum sp. TSH58]|uniref:hypothetical protein n=1 Tax=Azospirillum sp. TSH58 TaxID=664962 RepID=UPI000D5FF539|nr:hypothetical protein [Azospirillum sp. TSH58]AWJ82320.1 hypothetical protein TSH58p_01965 [Azospirillum sp. TSH58]PWC72956.1 hypothetical protein TSH58_06750 [Azospirillum sp. TSH58]